MSLTILAMDSSTFRPKRTTISAAPVSTASTPAAENAGLLLQANTNGLLDASLLSTSTQTDGQVLLTDGSGNLTWTTLTSLTATSGNITLTASGLVVLSSADGVKRGDGANFVTELYVPSITLTGASTNQTASALNFSCATYEGVIIGYKIKDTTSNAIRTGQIFVAVDSGGSAVSISDSYAETADVGVSWSAVINAGTVELQYTTTANNKVMRADLKFVPA